MLEIKAGYPQLEQIIYDDSRGLRHYDQDFIHSFEEIQEKGREYDQAQPGFPTMPRSPRAGAMTLRSSSIPPAPPASPRAWCSSPGTSSGSATNDVAFNQLREEEEILAYLPMAWVGDHLFGHAYSYVAGFCVSCPESSDTVAARSARVRPDLLLRPRRRSSRTS